ncbi:hypothetical protein llap_7061 [Limosa lapponica baueri]|uniref:Uncharacterized protein n=1 Tax=Limosa lapponica baueri TaxID=1758121 RepID=A0A2I0U991_LIMLA|nr:hypothetical protein llap_7061 [Limosa lapponica baueri]
MGSQFLQEDTVGDCIKGLAKVQVNNVHKISLIHQGGHFVIVGDWVCQAGPDFHEPVLAGSDHLGVLHALHNGTQDDLFRDLPRHRSQTDRPVVPWIILPALLVDGCHICWTPVSWDLPSLPGLLVNDGKWLSEHFYQLPQYPWVDPIWAHRLVYIQVLEKVPQHLPLDYGASFCSPPLSASSGVRVLREQPSLLLKTEAK